MIAILYPLKMDKNLSEAYSSIYEVSADLAIKAAKGAEKKRAESAKAGDTEGAKKAMGQNKKFFDYAKGKRQKENMPKKPTGPMANKPMPDPTSSYPGTPQIMKQGKMVKNSYEPEDDMVEGYKKIDKKKENKMYRRAGNLARQSISSNNEKEKYDKAKKSANIVSAISSQKEKERFDNMKTKKSELYNDTTGKYRAEWEQLKLMEMNDYRESFDEWITSIVEEGYDIERWTDEEMVDTFINELNLYNVQETVYNALMSVGDLQEGDKKGKGSGTKDACYHKVKSRYSVWPSAYASGALVKCRKKGAKNWGNSSKKEDFSNWREDLGLLDENRAAAYTAGMSPEQKAVEMRKISPKVADDAGRAHDKFMFSSRKKGGKENRKYEKEIRKSIPSDKPNRNKTGRGMPVSYRDSYEKDRDGVIQSKIRQGKGSFKDLGKKK